MPQTVIQKFAEARSILSSKLIERDEEIDIVLTALIAGENPLLVGPPGTAKSLLLDSLLNWCDPRNHVKKFSMLLTKFSTPEEVFGPISITQLKQDRFVRVTTGKLPEAHIAYLDEIFKASSAILNTTLRILNERVYDNGQGQLCQVPLKLCVAASNEWPNDENGGKELGALFDRFLFRRKVSPIRTEAGQHKLMWEPDLTPEFTNHIKLEEIEEAQKVASCLEWTQDAMDAFKQIVKELKHEGIQAGDRRMRKSIKAVQSYAFLNGRDGSDEPANTGVAVEHLEILAHTLWEDPTEQPEKAAKIIAKIANPSKMAVKEKLLAAQDVVSKAGNSVEIISKLQEIEKAMLKLPKSAESTKGIVAIKTMIKKEFTKVVGTGD